MYIFDEFWVEGRFYVNGEFGGGWTGGGGLGGSILVYVSYLDGEGSIEVIGGRGEYIGWKSLIKYF